MSANRRQTRSQGPMPPDDNPNNWTVRDFYAWRRKHVRKTWYKNDQFKLRRAIGFWVS